MLSDNPQIKIQRANSNHPSGTSFVVLAIINGYWLFAETPDYYSLMGMVLITLSGIYIFFREGFRKKPVAVKTSLRT